MESSTEPHLLDRHGKLLPDRIQKVLDELTPKLRRKFSMIRDEVVLTDILEEAGQQLVNRERERPIEHLYGYAWVALRNVAISKLRQSPYLLDCHVIGSAEGAAALSRLKAEESSPADIEHRILLAQLLARLSPRERIIAIWKKAERSSREIADHLGMSVAAVDTAYCRIRKKVRRFLR